MHVPFRMCFQNEKFLRYKRLRVLSMNFIHARGVFVVGSLRFPCCQTSTPRLWFYLSTARRTSQDFTEWRTCSCTWIRTLNDNHEKRTFTYLKIFSYFAKQSVKAFLPSDKF